MRTPFRCWKVGVVTVYRAGDQRGLLFGIYLQNFDVSSTSDYSLVGHLDGWEKKPPSSVHSNALRGDTRKASEI